MRAAKGGGDGGDGGGRQERDGGGGGIARGTVAAECSRITNLILQMDPKTWKQWNI